MNFIKIILIAAVLVFVMVDFILAQVPSPMLPGNPDQAPISGGLALLAAAGGAYAWRKLSKKAD